MHLIDAAAIPAAPARPTAHVRAAVMSAAVDQVFAEAYLDGRRPSLLGELSSHELLEADNRNGVLAPSIERDTSQLQFVFVDEPSCIGCREPPPRPPAPPSNLRRPCRAAAAGYCSEVARSTFRMEDEFGAARVFQQCGDEPEVIAEARDCCPVDCIHTVSFVELRVLEQHRQGLRDTGAMASLQGAGKLAARAEGRGGAPNWRAPLAGGAALLDSSGLEQSVEGDDPAVPPPPPLPGQELDWATLRSLYPEDEL